MLGHLVHKDQMYDCAWTSNRPRPESVPCRSSLGRRECVQPAAPETLTSMAGHAGDFVLLCTPDPSATRQETTQFQENKDRTPCWIRDIYPRLNLPCHQYWPGRLSVSNARSYDRLPPIDLSLARSRLAFRLVDTEMSKLYLTCAIVVHR